ncbi:unnamed protein product [Symbiodinium necroappetens]|uniref:Uncharacterized protein n=1 Tax=Symbiodinium necroappetens TaxID=1628268 RepID=A0A813AWJ1_9DINO|nr:unnamed protein product [Symbiodinium necroappetens]
MPRSSPESSSYSSSSYESLLSASGAASGSSADSGDLEAMQARAEAKAAAEARAVRERRRAMHRLAEWFAGAALLELCLYYWRGHLCMRGISDRRSLRARLATQRKNLEDCEPREALAIVAPQLDATIAAKLRKDFDALEALFREGVKENDVHWIEQTGQWGDPSQHVFLQHMSRMVLAHLQTRLDPECAEEITPALVEIAGRRLSQPSIEVLFPLLGEDGQREFQQWYMGFSGRTAHWVDGAQNTPAASSTAATGLESTANLAVHMEDGTDDHEEQDADDADRG